MTGAEDVMAKIGFIGLGNMGLPMAQNLINAGHSVAGFDVNEAAIERVAAGGGRAAGALADACADAEIVITMLPAGEHVREVYLDGAAVLADLGPGTLRIDAWSLDV